MFLLHIEPNKIKKDDLLQISNIQTLTKQIKNQIFYFNILKKTENTKNLRFLISNLDISKYHDYGYYNTIRYIIGISIYNTNTIIYVSDIKGTIKFFCSAGSLHMNKKQKTKKVPVLIKLLKFMKQNIEFISKKDLIALHLKNFNRPLGLFVWRFLLRYHEIVVTTFNNNQPHNGCRPRKPKRKKRQRLKFKTGRRIKTKYNFDNFEGMTERFKVTNCKFVGFSIVGSNPTSFKNKDRNITQR